jgi:DNA-binding response OmpR family regulator
LGLPGGPVMAADNRHIRILVVGREAPLREIYAILFNRAGYQAEAADIEGALRLLTTVKAHVLVIDHTLSKEQRHWFVHSARQLSSTVRILALHSAAKDSGADLVMDSRLGPDAILANLALLIPRRKPMWVWVDNVKSMLRFGSSVKAG